VKQIAKGYLNSKSREHRCWTKIKNYKRHRTFWLLRLMMVSNTWRIK